ncbi:MAG: hypothetical protein P8X89_22755 [Reinekea sp.]
MASVRRTGWDGGTVENGDAGQSRFDVCNSVSPESTLESRIQAI